MFKKTLALILAAATVFCLCSCGKGKDKDDKKTSSQNTVSRKAVSEKEVVWEDDPIVESEGYNIAAVPAMRDLNYYEEQIAAFEAQPIEEGKIIFYGSSGFTRWSTKYGNISLESALTSSTGERVCINHGFGGSTMHELCYYYDRAVKPWNPKALVVTSFLNDYAYYSNEQMMKFVQYLFSRARKDFPGIKLYITDWRPTAKSLTAADVQRRQDMNKLLLAYAKVHPDVKVIEMSKEPMFYVDSESAAAGSYTDINKAIFVEDQIHYTPEGYKRYAEVFKRELADVLG